MSTDGTAFEWRYGLPVLVDTDAVSAQMLTHWIEMIGQALDIEFAGHSVSHGIRVASTHSLGMSKELRQHASRCYARLHRLLGPKAFRGVSPEVVILHFGDHDPYYRYLEAYFPEGSFGGSVGVQIREGYKHIALWGTHGYQLGPTIAHELLHLAVTEDKLPLWIEEGLAQMFEMDMGSNDAIAYRQDDIVACRSYWQQNNLTDFWSGRSFTKPGEVQKYAYLLAEIIVRNLISDYGRRSWFRRKKQTAFSEFLWLTHHEDAGDAAARIVFGKGIEQIASQFLGQI